MKSDIKNVGEALYWSYANLAMAHVAYKDSDAKYTAKHYGIRKKLYLGLKSGDMKMRSFFDDERLKMVIPNGCAYCGSREHLAADHILARKRGGVDTGENLISACRTCNSSKRDKDMIEWIRSSDKIPSILLYRRYLKLATSFCKNNGFMNIALDDPRVSECPFTINSLFVEPFDVNDLKLWSFDISDVPKKESGEKKSTYRVATWNVERPKRGIKSNRALEKLKTIDADLLVLTESTTSFDLSGYPYSIYTRTTDNLPDDYWSSIHSKWRIKEEISTFEPKRTVCGLIASPLGEIIVYAGIIPYQMAGTGVGKYGDLGLKPWQMHKEDIESQHKDWLVIQRDYPGVPLFVIGDFNQTRDLLPGGYGTKQCREILSDALSDNNLVCLTEIDFGGKKLIDPDPKTGKVKRMVDHICVSESFVHKVNTYEIGAWNNFNDEGKAMSDHCGVYLDIS